MFMSIPCVFACVYVRMCVEGEGARMHMHELSVVVPTHECLLACVHVHMCTCTYNMTISAFLPLPLSLPPSPPFLLSLSSPHSSSLSPSIPFLPPLPLSLPPPLPPPSSLCLLRNSKVERSCPQSGTSSRRPLVVKHSKQEPNTSPEQSSGPLTTHILTQHTSLSPLMFR